MPDGPVILFTAFEPSGDALAAPVIRALRERRPDWEVWALGGPKMAAAGAELLQITTEHAAMGTHAVAHVIEQVRRLNMLRTWMTDYRPIAHVPVDSPAANWSICKLVRKRVRGAKVVHLAAPQLWAWASWRIRRMRRLSDHVLCLLPFEPDWFGKRNMPGTFVGHPLFDGGQDSSDNAAGNTSIPPLPLPDAAVRVAVLPGSRPAEVESNWPTMAGALEQVRATRPNIAAVVAAADERAAQRIRSINDTHTVVEGRTDDVLQACDVALVASGTATLLTARHRTPMVAMYNVNTWTWNLLGRWLVKTRTFTLPNLIAEHANRPRIAPEFVPHFGQVEPIAETLGTLIDSDEACQTQVEAMDWLASHYDGVRYVDRATTTLLDVIGQ